MRRLLALHAAVTLLAAAPAGASEPLDLDLTRLGAPTGAIWTLMDGTLPGAQATALAADSRVRFGRLASDLGLAFSSALLQPASTTGHSGFHFDMEGAYAAVGNGVAGSTAYGTAFPRSYWVTKSLQPHELFLPSVHVRKSLPFSLELGGRLYYLSQSSYFGAQLEGKWSLVEGFSVLPDVALRVAHTMVLGQRDLRLSTTEFAGLVSKRIGVNAVSSLTPYAAARFTLLDASTKRLGYAPDFLANGNPAPADPATLQASSAPFPTLSSIFYRTTAGLRLTSYAVSLAAEVTYFGGGKQGKKGAGEGDYPQFYVPSSWSSAFKLGFEF